MMMYKQLQNLDNLTINFSESGIFLVNIILAFIMFGIALEIKFSDFKQVFYRPKSLVIGLASQLVALPLVTFGLVVIFYRWIPPSVALGMLLVAACPGGNMSNFISSLARSNTALSVSLTGITTMAALVMTPLNFRLWGGWYLRFLSQKSNVLEYPLQISFPHMLFTLFILLALPLTVGMLGSYFFPKATKKIIKPVKWLSLIAFFTILTLSLVNNFSHFIDNLGYIFLVVLVHNTLAFATGFSLAKLFKVSVFDRRTISIETGIQNSGLGLAMLFNSKIFPAGVVTGGMLFVTAWWGIWHIVAGLVVALFCRKKEAMIKARNKQ